MRKLRPVVLLALLAAAACDGPTLAPEESATPEPAVTFGFRDVGELRTGFMLGADGTVVEVVYEVRPEGYFIEGDIQIRPGEVFATREEASRSTGARLGIVVDNTSRRWPGSTVYYAFDPSFTNRQYVLDAMSHIQQTTNTRFVARTTQSDYVYITAGSGCYSSLGRVGGRQTLSLGTGCEQRGIAIHEFGHALGMHHEQNRCDRDSYIIVHWDNIQDQYRSQFNKTCTGARDVYEYNEGSIMHYSATSASKNGQPTMTSLRNRTLGQLNGLNTIDVQTINWMYPSGGGGTAPCTACTLYSGSLSGTGAQQVQPNGSYYQSTVSGTHRGWLRGPSGTNFNLYLQRWNGSAWSTVARGELSGSSEDIAYSGTAGYYRWIVSSASGSGSYSFYLSRP